MVDFVVFLSRMRTAAPSVSTRVSSAVTSILLLLLIEIQPHLPVLWTPQQLHLI